MALEAKEVVDPIMGGEEALSVPRRLEAFYLFACCGQPAADLVRKALAELQPLR